MGLNTGNAAQTLAERQADGLVSGANVLGEMKSKMAGEELCPETQLEGCGPVWHQEGVDEQKVAICLCGVPWGTWITGPSGRDRTECFLMCLTSLKSFDKFPLVL